MELEDSSPTPARYKSGLITAWTSGRDHRRGIHRMLSLLPRMISLIDKTQPEGKKLSSQYLSIIEVGGAYAHIFFDLLEFLELRTLVITDIDTVAPNEKGHQTSCQVAHGKGTSNACIKTWFNKSDITPNDLIAVNGPNKVNGKRRIAYQHPEAKDGPCGRSFEDAFMLANPQLFEFVGPSVEEQEKQARTAALDVKKSEFALYHALIAQDWNTPAYIRDGLLWLAENDQATPTVPTAAMVVV